MADEVFPDCRALNYTRAGGEVWVKVPGRSGTVRAIAGNDILGNKVTLIGGTAFSEVFQSLQRIETGRFLHVRPVEEESVVSSTVWCIGWIWNSLIPQTLANRWKVYFQSSLSTEAIALVELDDVIDSSLLDTIRYQNFNLNLSIVSQTSFVAEISYQRLRYDVVGFDFSGPIIDLKIDEIQKGLLIQGTEITIIRSAVHTILDDPTALPDTSEGATRYLSNYAPGNIFNFYTPVEGAPLSSYDTNTVTIIPRAYFGNFARYKPLAPDPDYVAPPDGQGWVYINPVTDSYVNDQIYGAAIALSADQIARLRDYAARSESFGTTYQLNTNSVDAIATLLDSRCPASGTFFGVAFVSDESGNADICFRPLRTGTNPDDVVFVGNSVEQSFIQDVLYSTNINDLIFILGELQETLDIEIYSIPTTRSLAAVGNTDLSFGTKVATAQIPLTNASLIPVFAADRTDKPVRGGGGAGPSIIFKVALFES